MSKCISSHGEYSDHEPGDPCPYCGEYDTDRIIAERDQAEARIQAVRKLHTAFEWSFGYGPVKSCRECARRSPQEDAAYPCPTIRALDELS